RQVGDGVGARAAAAASRRARRVVALRTAATTAAADALDEDRERARALGVARRAGREHDHVRRGPRRRLEGGRAAPAVRSEHLPRRARRRAEDTRAAAQHDSRAEAAERDRARRREAGEAREGAGDRAAADDREPTRGVADVPTGDDRADDGRIAGERLRLTAAANGDRAGIRGRSDIERTASEAAVDAERAARRAGERRAEHREGAAHRRVASQCGDDELVRVHREVACHAEGAGDGRVTARRGHVELVRVHREVTGNTERPRYGRIAEQVLRLARLTDVDGGRGRRADGDRLRAAVVDREGAARWPGDRPAPNEEITGERQLTGLVDTELGD